MKLAIFKCGAGRRVAKDQQNCQRFPYQQSNLRQKVQSDAAVPEI